MYLSDRSLIFWTVSLILILVVNFKDYKAKNMLYKYVETLNEGGQAIEIMDVV